MPFVEYRTRDLAVLLTEAEWGWSVDPDAAFVFPMYELPEVSSSEDYARSAEFHARALKLAGDKNWVCASVYGSQASQARAERAGAAVAAASVRETGVIIPEPEFETGGRPPIRRGDKIQERIRKARERAPRGRVHIDPAEVFAREERRHLA